MADRLIDVVPRGTAPRLARFVMRAFAVVLAVTLATGCSGDEPEGGSPGGAAAMPAPSSGAGREVVNGEAVQVSADDVAVAVPCESAIEVTDDLPDSVDEVADGLAIPVGEPLQIGQRGTPLDPGSSFAFSKMGVAIRAGAVVAVFVRAPSQANALLDWGGSAAGPVHAVRFGPCPTDGGSWYVFAGGVWTLQPGCVELLVATVDRSDDLDLPVGEEC